MTGLGRFIAFDAKSGLLRAEAGISLSEILACVVPLGWFLPTTPGTRFVTLGGSVANDVHGKNHHSAGSIGLHVTAIGLLRSDGFRSVIEPAGDTSALFAATVGGLGLTGVMEWIEIQLTKIGSAYLDVETIPFTRLDDFWTLAEKSAEQFEHTVAWIDCNARGTHFGRGIFSRANWRDDGNFQPHHDRTWKRVPFAAPRLPLGRFGVEAFNELYFRLHQSGRRREKKHYTQFFYPLDSIRDWNRLYGKRGFFQYQCVIPADRARTGIASLLDAVVRSGQASFLAVLKTLGTRLSPGLLSFPRPGATLALDFPNRGAETLRLLSGLDEIVADAGGALYPAKDGRIGPELFRLSFPKWQAFIGYKDPGMTSDFWRRVGE